MDRLYGSEPVLAPIQSSRRLKGFEPCRTTPPTSTELSKAEVWGEPCQVGMPGHLSAELRDVLPISLMRGPCWQEFKAFDLKEHKG